MRLQPKCSIHLTIARWAIAMFAALALPAASPERLGAGATSAGASASAKARPNLLIDVSAALVNAAVQRSVDRLDPIQETITDTQISGMSRTLGVVGSEFVPSDCRGIVDIIFEGGVGAQTVATRPHVLIYTSTTTPLQVRRRLLIDAQGIYMQPGPGYASSTTCLLDITSRREPDQLAMKFAGRTFQQNKSLIEIETARKTAQRVANQLGDDLTPHLLSASQSVGTGLKSIKEAGLSVGFLDFVTTPSFLQAQMRVGTVKGNPVGIPPPLPEGMALGVRMHQSVLNETAQILHGGKSFPLDTVSKFYQQATFSMLLDSRKKLGTEKLEQLEKSLAALGGKPAIITLASKAPISVQFTRQGFTIEIGIASFRQDGVDHAGMRVRGVYRLENPQTGVGAVRQGAVQFLELEDVPASKKLVPQPPSFLLVREVLFSEILKERFVLADLSVPEALSNRRFSAAQGQSQDGWLVLGWKLR